MKDYAALEAAAAQNPRLNDVLVQQGENFISLRSAFGLWLKKEGRQINAPTVESLQEYPPATIWSWILRRRWTTRCILSSAPFR